MGLPGITELAVIAIVAVLLIGVPIALVVAVVASTSRKRADQPNASTGTGLMITVILAVIFCLMICGGILVLAFGYLALDSAPAVDQSAPPMEYIIEDRMIEVEGMDAAGAEETGAEAPRKEDAVGGQNPPPDETSSDAAAGRGEASPD